MDNYFKITNNGYIESVGIGTIGTPISEMTYNFIMQLVQNRPTPREGYEYRLKEDFTWEEYIPEEDTENKDGD